MDITTLIAARKYTDNALSGLGSLKGKPCTIDSITNVNGVTVVKFKWYSLGSDGVTETANYSTLELNKNISLWTGSTKYYQYDIVIHNSYIYYCITDNEDATFVPSHWSKLGSIKEMSLQTSSSSTLIMDANTLYDLGELSDDDEIDLTIRIPDNSIGSEIYHCKFVAGATDQSITISSSDGNDIEIKGTVEFEVGSTYEISIWDYVAIIG